MKPFRSKRASAIGAVALGLAVVAAAGGVAAAGSGAGSGDEESGSQNYTRAEKDAATKAALGATHGGEANSVERDSEDGATWEVEITRTDGSTVDVRLDQDFGVVVIEGDVEDTNGK